MIVGLDRVFYCEPGVQLVRAATPIGLMGIADVVSECA